MGTLSSDDDSVLEPAKVSVYIDCATGLLNNSKIFWGSDTIKKKAKGFVQSYSVIVCDGKNKKKVVVSGNCENGNPVFHAIADKVDIKSSCEPMALRVYAHFRKKEKEQKFMIGQVVVSHTSIKRGPSDGKWENLSSRREELEATHDVSQPSGFLTFKAWVDEYREPRSSGGRGGLFAKSTPDLSGGSKSGALAKFKSKFRSSKKAELHIANGSLKKMKNGVISKSMSDISGGTFLMMNDIPIDETDTDRQSDFAYSAGNSRSSSFCHPNTYPEESNPFNAYEGTNPFDLAVEIPSARLTSTPHIGNGLSNHDRSRSMHNLGAIDSECTMAQGNTPNSLSRVSGGAFIKSNAASGGGNSASHSRQGSAAGSLSRATAGANARARAATVTRTPSAKTKPGINSFMPHQASVEGGSMLIIYGTKLGNCDADVRCVRVAGQEYTNKEVERHSSSKLTLRLRPALRCCSGPIEVETKSVGLISSSSAFAFVTREEAECGERAVSPRRAGSFELRDSPSRAPGEQRRRTKSQWDLTAATGLAGGTAMAVAYSAPDSPNSQRSSGLGSDAGDTGSGTIARNNSSQGFTNFFKKNGSLKKKELLADNERLKNELEEAHREITTLRRSQQLLEQRCVELEICLADRDSEVNDYKSKMEGYLLCILEGRTGTEALKTLEVKDPLRQVGCLRIK